MIDSDDDADNFVRSSSRLPSLSPQRSPYGSGSPSLSSSDDEPVWHSTSSLSNHPPTIGGFGDDRWSLGNKAAQPASTSVKYPFGSNIVTDTTQQTATPPDSGDDESVNVLQPRMAPRASQATEDSGIGGESYTVVSSEINDAVSEDAEMVSRPSSAEGQ